MRKIQSGADAKPAWIVTPSDRRRKDEEISEKALGNIINAQDAVTNRGPKVKTIKPTTNGNNNSSRESSPTSLSNTSDGSLDEPQIPKRRSGRGSPRSDDNSEIGASDDVNNGKRKINLDDADGNIINGSKRSNKVQKTVTFSDATGSGATATATKKKVVSKPSVNKKVTSTRTIGTRSTRGSGAEVELLPELPVKKKVPKVKKVVTDDNVTVVKMLTGTLYLYRGDRPRAEFVRFK